LKKSLYFFILLLIFCAMTVNCAYTADTNIVKQNIVKQAKAMGVEPAIVLSIAKTESGFNQNAKSSGGHIGVFQLSKTTAKNLGINPYVMEDNIKGGIIYYKKMYDRFGSMELAVAAYNVGPDIIRRNNNTVPKYTRAFVSRIMNDYKYYKKSNL